MCVDLIETAAFSAAPSETGAAPETNPDPSMPRDKADHYEFMIAGLLDSHWISWFDGLRICHTADGNTILGGVLPDQAALHGVLERIRDLNLTLLYVIRLAGAADAGHRDDPPAG